MIELAWMREIVKDCAPSTRRYLQRQRETLRAAQTASHILISAGRTESTSLGAGDFAASSTPSVRSGAPLAAACTRPRTAT
jgi:hypothetical protein